MHSHPFLGAGGFGMIKWILFFFLLRKKAGQLVQTYSMIRACEVDGGRIGLAVSIGRVYCKNGKRNGSSAAEVGCNRWICVDRPTCNVGHHGMGIGRGGMGIGIIIGAGLFLLLAGVTYRPAFDI
ncbi:hypothetical protein FN846DRAFT_167127 [Sphaerosporella brunnea]|uniref:Uncharacterized protein n=1 Tax=Sphaerosporella brunnea TaxID=1250544 RepID=A0A5J5EQN5_9PEZI|nr:hypothetical protein FN846DRAFT_167127 [Sphaerosporella brunnea]